VTGASYTAVPLLTVVLAPFLWPRKLVLAFSGSVLLLLLLIETALYLLVAETPSAGLHVTSGLFLSLVSLGVSWLLVRVCMTATLGALFGFGVVCRELARALLSAPVGWPARLRDVVGRLALPGVFPTLHPLHSPDRALAQADLGSFSGAVLAALAIGLLP